MPLRKAAAAAALQSRPVSPNDPVPPDSRPGLVFFSLFKTNVTDLVPNRISLLASAHSEETSLRHPGSARFPTPLDWHGQLLPPR